MTTATAIISNLTSDEFSGDVYEALSVTAQVAAFVTRRANVIRISHGLYKTNKLVKSLLDLVDDAISGKRELVEKQTTRQDVQRVAENLDHLVRTIEYLYESLRRAQLTNNSIVAGPLATLHSAIEPLKDIADWADLSAKPQELASILARAKVERERGEMYEMKRVE
jgi:hypothetical protein